jgi:hypothetical protein
MSKPMTCRINVLNLSPLCYITCLQDVFHVSKLCSHTCYSINTYICFGKFASQLDVTNCPCVCAHLLLYTFILSIPIKYTGLDLLWAFTFVHYLTSFVCRWNFALCLIFQGYAFGLRLRCEWVTSRKLSNSDMSLLCCCMHFRLFCVRFKLEFFRLQEKPY